MKKETEIKNQLKNELLNEIQNRKIVIQNVYEDSVIKGELKTFRDSYLQMIEWFEELVKKL